MSVLLYHGSDRIIKRPEYGQGAKTNDYGRGFYCTREPELAKEWACKSGRNGYVNAYHLDESGLYILNLNDSGYHILNWLAILAKNRTYWQNGSISQEAKEYIQEHFLPDTSGADVIIGYRADDSYFAFAQDFASGTISLRKLSEAMRLGALGEQVVLISEKAFAQIHFVGSESADAGIYYAKKMERERKARKEYREKKAAQSGLQEIYILDIMRERMQNDDARLF